MTLETWLTQWIDLRTAALAPRTIESYRALLRRYVAPIGAVDIDELTPDQVSLLLASICAGGHSRTAQLVFVFLRAALRDAVRCGRLTRSPLDMVLRPRHYPQTRGYLPEEELRELVAWCLAHPSPWSLAWLLAALCGLRRGEIAGLRWADVEVSGSKLLKIRNQRQTISGQGTVSSPPKSRAGVREIPIPAPLAPVLRAERQRQRLQQAAGGLPATWVISQADNRPVTPSALDHALRRDLATAGLPPVTLHGLRHSMATMAMQTGCPLRVLQTILGHASPATTAAIYQHVQLSDKIAALDAITKACYNGF